MYTNGIQHSHWIKWNVFFSLANGSCRWCSFFWIRQTCQWCASWRLCNFLSKIACLLPSHLFRVTPVRNWTFESNHETDAGRPQNDVPPTHKWDWTYLILKPMENSRVSSFQWSYTGFFRDQIIWNLFCEDQTSNKMMYQKPFWLILFLKMVSIVWIKCHFNRSHLYLTFWWSPTPFVKRLILRPRPSFFPPTASPEPLRMGGMPRLRVHHPLHWKVW